MIKGAVRERLRDCWRNMQTRCYDPDYHSYHRYGGRGIQVCKRWLDWGNFLTDNQAQYKLGYSLDRINNDGDYCPENCRWIPRAENKKQGLVDPAVLLAEYNSGILQKELAAKYGTDQPHISRILKRARRGQTL